MVNVNRAAGSCVALFVWMTVHEFTMPNAICTILEIGSPLTCLLEYYEEIEWKYASTRFTRDGTNHALARN